MWLFLLSVAAVAGVLSQKEVAKCMVANGFKAPTDYVAQLTATYGHPDYIAREDFAELWQFLTQ